MSAGAVIVDVVWQGYRLHLMSIEEASCGRRSHRPQGRPPMASPRRGCARRRRAEQADPSTLAAIEARLAEVRRKIPKLVDALAAGPEDLRSVRGALVELEREQDRLETAIAGARRAAAAASDDATVDRTVGTLLERLHDFRRVLETGEPEERKEIVRCFVEGIRIEKVTRRAHVRWYRLPSVKFESPSGIEPRPRVEWAYRTALLRSAEGAAGASVPPCCIGRKGVFSRAQNRSSRNVGSRGGELWTPFIALSHSPPS